MAQPGQTTIQIYSSSTASAVPSPSNLVAGELALNLVDKKVFTKNNIGSVVEMTPSATNALAVNAGGTGSTSAAAARTALGAGDVVGPASSTDNTLARFDGTTGKLLQGSGVVVDDSNNVGLGVAISPWSGWGNAAVDLPTFGAISGGSQMWVGGNWYYSGGVYKYKSAGFASAYSQINGDHVWRTAPSGAADATATFTALMTLGASGGLTLSVGNLTVLSGTLGYGTGAGGTVTQITSKATNVTLNKPSGRVTTHNAALGAGASVTFIVFNTFCTASDTVSLSLNGGLAGPVTDYALTCSAGGNLFVVGVRNVTGGSLSEALQIEFNVIKGSTT